MLPLDIARVKGARWKKKHLITPVRPKKERKKSKPPRSSVARLCRKANRQNSTTNEDSRAWGFNSLEILKLH